MEQFFVDYLNPLSLILLLTGGIYFIAGWIQEKYPPKSINSIYGYRTKASMRNPEVWKFAQEVSSKKMKRDGLYLIVLGLLLSFFDLKRPGLFMDRDCPICLGTSLDVNFCRKTDKKTLS
jgi:hypothetical protein